MPLYDFKCPTCKYEAHDVFRKMHSSLPDCPKCGTDMEHVPTLCHTDMKAFHTPVKLYSVACNSMEEIREMQAAGVPCSDDPNDEDFGVPVATTRKEKLAALKTAGFIETK